MADVYLGPFQKLLEEVQVARQKNENLLPEERPVFWKSSPCFRRDRDNSSGAINSTEGLMGQKTEGPGA